MKFFLIAVSLIIVSFAYVMDSEPRSAVAKSQSYNPQVTISIPKSSLYREVTYRVKESTVNTEKNYLTGKEMKIRSVTIEFSEDIFGYTYNYKNGKLIRVKTDNSPSDKLLDEAIQDPLFSEGGLSVNGKTLNLIDTGSGQTTKQVEWLIPKIEKLFNIKLIKQ